MGSFSCETIKITDFDVRKDTYSDWYKVILTFQIKVYIKFTLRNAMRYHIKFILSKTWTDLLMHLQAYLLLFVININFLDIW